MATARAQPGSAEMLAEFHERFNYERSSDPSLRATLHREEHEELLHALDCEGLDQVARELADVVYVAYGSAWSLDVDLDAIPRRAHEPLPMTEAHAQLQEVLGSNDREAITVALANVVDSAYGLAADKAIDLDAAIVEVHRSNMSKLDDDGNPIYREDGKVLKGPNFRPPDMSLAIAGSTCSPIHACSEEARESGPTISEYSALIAFISIGVIAFVSCQTLPSLAALLVSATCAIAILIASNLARVRSLSAGGDR